MMKNWWTKLNGPVKIGLVFALIAIMLTVIGIIRDPGTPNTLWAFVVGSLISGATWGLVSWAIATAAVTVEKEVAEGESHDQN